MSKELKTILDEAKGVHLSTEEKTTIRRHLVAFMGTHPVREAGAARLLWQRSILSFRLNHQSMSIILSLILLLSAGSGVSFAAEKSVPGDILYPVKVHVNEEVRAAVALQVQDAAAWQVRRAERRLEEAETLAREGNFNADARVRLEQSFTAHAEKAQARITELEASGKTEEAAALSAQLEASLRIHRVALVTLAARGETSVDEDGELHNFIEDIEVQQKAAASERARVETRVQAAPQVNVQASAEASIRSAQHKVDESSRFIESVKARLGAETTVQAEVQLAVAKKTLVDAQAKLNAKAYGEAFVLARRAHREAQAAKLLVELTKNLEVDLPVPPVEEEEDIQGNAQEGQAIPNRFFKTIEEQQGEGEGGVSGEVHGNAGLHLEL